jgi:hypothetical protein
MDKLAEGHSYHSYSALQQESKEHCEISRVRFGNHENPRERDGIGGWIKQHVILCYHIDVMIAKKVCKCASRAFDQNLNRKSDRSRTGRERIPSWNKEKIPRNICIRNSNFHAFDRLIIKIGMKFEWKYLVFNINSQFNVTTRYCGLSFYRNFFFNSQSVRRCHDVRDEPIAQNSNCDDDNPMGEISMH